MRMNILINNLLREVREELLLTFDIKLYSRVIISDINVMAPIGHGLGWLGRKRFRHLSSYGRKGRDRGYSFELI